MTTVIGSDQLILLVADTYVIIRATLEEDDVA